MYMLEFGLLIFTVCIPKCTGFESGQGYYDDYSESVDIKDEESSELENMLRSASSVDDIMTILYPEYWKIVKCYSRKGSQIYQKEYIKYDAETEETIKYAAAFYNPEILKSIDIEWRKTQCVPREVCVDVSKEYGTTTSTFFKPPCVTAFRCGGCCNSEGIQCMNVSTSYISKTLFEITVPMSQGPRPVIPMSQSLRPVTISFANHTSCRCMSRLDLFRQVHSIIRRSLPGSQCHVTNRTCPSNYSWNNQLCRCTIQHGLSFPSQHKHSDVTEEIHDICGPGKELDEGTCQCVCKGELWPGSCGPHKEMDTETCQCRCKNKLLAHSCGVHREFNPETCQCVCARKCPKHQPLNVSKCVCECTESPNKCFLKGMKYNQHNCSCYRPPCIVRTRRCDHGFYFSEEVCRCVPTYWRLPTH
ncbi:vascular endothelial growth factor C [Protopterus annectens]|uniref:vascular endothelial growth factor C n=1 Tax=Protopterus annectens TaxID=7888 RepID=UPI001CFB8358|nr:vascular endothelial growth factor C [Protopterus annectens]